MQNIKELLVRLSEYLLEYSKTKKINDARKIGEVICKIILLNSSNEKANELSNKTKYQELLDAISKNNLSENENHLKKIKIDLKALQDFGNIDSHDNSVKINEQDIKKIDLAVDGIIRNVFDSKEHIDIDEKIPQVVLHHINKPTSENEDWKCEKLISIVYPNRKVYQISNDKDYLLFSLDDVNENKIGFVFLGRNISILSTIKKLFEYNSDNIKDLVSISFLFPKEISRSTGEEVKNRKQNIINKSKEYDRKYSKTKFIYEFIEDYIWKNCLTDNLKSNSNISTEPYFIDQWLYHNNEKKISLGLLDDIINHKSTDDKPIHIILGDGGVGKTTFCEQAVQKVDHLLDQGLKKKAILLSSFDLPDELQHLESTVDSIESLYKILQDDDNQTLNSQSLKLNISSGNILIIVDGLDEIESKLKERFNLEKFIKSVIELNHTFLNCSVIITSRGNDPKKFYHDNINIYTLKGFDDDLVEKYLNKRFKNNSKSTNDVQSYISGLELENNKKVTPLIIKLICDFVESQGEDEIPNSDFNEKSKYFNLSNPLDIVVNQIISREIIKQDINISSDDYFEILKDIVFDYNCLISKKDLDELIECTLIDGGIGNTKNFTNFYVSPLLFRDKGNFRIKYDSLEFWIKSRYIAYRINNEKGESSNSVIEVLTRDCYKGGDLVNEISKFTKNNNTSYYVSVIKGCLDKLSKEECDNEIIYKKTISAILYLSMPKGSYEKLEYSELILELFNKGKGEVIQFLSIYGIFFPLDFNLFTVLNGYFDSYSNLSKSEIPKDKEIFIDCEFKNIDKSSFGKQHVQDINFRNCILPNTIKDLISTSKQTKQDQIDNIKNDLRKIFKVGFRQNTFQWKSEGLYRQQCASLKHKLVLSKYIQILVQESFFEIELEKASGGKTKGYKLPHNKEETIKDFLTQGIIKNEIKALIDKLIN